MFFHCIFCVMGNYLYNPKNALTPPTCLIVTYTLPNEPNIK